MSAHKSVPSPPGTRHLNQGKKMRFRPGDRSCSVLIVSLHNTGRLTVCSKSPAVHVVCNEEFEPSEDHHNNKGSNSRD